MDNMTLRIVIKADGAKGPAVGHATFYNAETGEEIHGICSAEITVRSDDIVRAKLEFTVNELDVHAAVRGDQMEIEQDGKNDDSLDG